MYSVMNLPQYWFSPKIASKLNLSSFVLQVENKFMDRSTISCGGNTHKHYRFDLKGDLDFGKHNPIKVPEPPRCYQRAHRVALDACRPPPPAGVATGTFRRRTGFQNRSLSYWPVDEIVCRNSNAIEGAPEESVGAGIKGLRDEAHSTKLGCWLLSESNRKFLAFAMFAKVPLSCMDMSSSLVLWYVFLTWQQLHDDDFCCYRCCLPASSPTWLPFLLRLKRWVRLWLLVILLEFLSFARNVRYGMTSAWYGAFWPLERPLALLSCVRNKVGKRWRKYTWWAAFFR